MTTIAPSITAYSMNFFNTASVTAPFAPIFSNHMTMGRLAMMPTRDPAIMSVTKCRPKNGRVRDKVTAYTLGRTRSIQCLKRQVGGAAKANPAEA